MSISLTKLHLEEKDLLSKESNTHITKNGMNDSRNNLNKKTQPYEVKISIQFLRIGEIDTINEKYYAEICVEAQWVQHGYIKEYDPDLHWNPKIVIENSIFEPKEKVTYEVKKFYDMVKIRESRYLKGFFWEKLELENFPLDIQELSIVVSSKLTSDELELVSDSERPSMIDYKATRIFVDQQKWNLYKFVQISNSASYDNTNESESKADKIFGKFHNKANNFPKFVATLFVSRRPG